MQKTYEKLIKVNKKYISNTHTNTHRHKNKQKQLKKYITKYNNAESFSFKASVRLCPQLNFSNIIRCSRLILHKCCLLQMASRSSSSFILMGEPFGDVLTKIFPSSVQTLNNKPSLLISFARLTIFLL